MEALSTALPAHNRLANDINKVMGCFELQVYGILSEECKVVNKSKKSPKVKHPSRLLEKLRRDKRETRKCLRQLNRKGLDPSAV